MDWATFGIMAGVIVALACVVVAQSRIASAHQEKSHARMMMFFADGTATRELERTEQAIARMAPMTMDRAKGGLYQNGRVAPQRGGLEEYDMTAAINETDESPG